MDFIEINSLIQQLAEANAEIESLRQQLAEAKQKDINTWYLVDDDGNAKYKGQWENGLPNGTGIKFFFETATRNYTIIEGQFVNGFAHGYGKQIYHKSYEKMVPYYEGEFRQNCFHGKGVYHYGTGSYKKGEWSNNKMNGYGEDYSHMIDQTWVGTFCNDKKVDGEWVKGKV